MEKKTVIELFQKFVGTSDFRVTLRKPFKQDGYFVATDGHSLISIPDDYMDLEFEPAINPPNNIKGLIERDGGKDYKISSKALLEFIEKNVLMIPESQECSECDGDGYRECDLGHEHDCEICDGTGKIIPRNPKNVKNKKTIFEICGVWYSYIELKRIIDSIGCLGFNEFTLNNGENMESGVIKIDVFTFLIMRCLPTNHRYISEEKFLVGEQIKECK